MCREQVTSMFPREYKREKIKSPVALGAVKEASLSEFDLTANLFRGASPTAAAAAPYPSVTSEATLSAPMILTTGPALRHAWNIYRTCSLCLPRASMRWVSSRRLLVSSTCQRLARKCSASNSTCTGRPMGSDTPQRRLVSVDKVRRCRGHL